MTTHGSGVVEQIALALESSVQERPTVVPALADGHGSTTTPPATIHSHGYLAEVEKVEFGSILVQKTHVFSGLEQHPPTMYQLEFPLHIREVVFL